nr:hypothetical protein CFP56_71320 [Quercus suber]
MVHTVGIVGVNGNVGAPTAKALAGAAEQGKIHLIIFSREGSTAKGLSPSQNVEFRTLNFDDPPEKIQAALAGVNVFISAVAFGALSTEPNVVQALAKSKDFVTYIPSTYSTTWTTKDFEDPQLGPVLNFIHSGWNKAKELGISITPLYIGAFENYWFDFGFVGAPLKGNTVWANQKQLQKGVAITHLDHVASSLTQIATSDPREIAGKSFSAVTFWPTGQELVDLYTKLNGKQAQIKDWTAKDREEMMADGANFGPAKVGYWDRWESGDWHYDAGSRVVLGGYSGPGLEEVARRFL